MDTTTRKLSRLQRAILSALAQLSAKAGAADPLPLVEFHDVRAIVWKGRSSPTPATQAAFSRALARLEARGLIRRERWVADAKGRRVAVSWSAQLRLTAAGADVAKRLTSE